jgi:hypothetical protein
MQPVDGPWGIAVCPVAMDLIGGQNEELMFLHLSTAPAHFEPALAFGAVYQDVVRTAFSAFHKMMPGMGKKSRRLQGDPVRKRIILYPFPYLFGNVNNSLSLKTIADTWHSPVCEKSKNSKIIHLMGKLFHCTPLAVSLFLPSMNHSSNITTMKARWFFLLWVVSGLLLTASRCSSPDTVLSVEGTWQFRKDSLDQG